MNTKTYFLHQWVMAVVRVGNETIYHYNDQASAKY